MNCVAMDSNNNVLVKNWPHQLTETLAKAIEPEPHDSVLVPITYHEVYCNHAHLLLYKNPQNGINNNTLYPVCIQIQGILEKSLFTLHFAPSATQNITLGSGPFKDQWESLLLAISNLHQLVHISLDENGYKEPPITAMCSLYMQRRVFSKITATNCEVSSALHTTDDPSHKADFVNDKWRVLQKITLARKDSQGKLGIKSDSKERQLPANTSNTLSIAVQSLALDTE
ncbi:hypothetical protein SERLADRAFT_404760 [Serpula lacrymans var. lacrymans S7.9]|uniref:Uncharacterized protein n=1 Tax=Serpula lacrymans var. lacrymans (strain S7.9) TaxID=578457 RepID=F8NCV9_SERL9|nr:uncharacterized protein SERLADRAFT_404760 [Serpula lacrymans var. lacrymans S7.9]EGO30703.1 hypothetical protein SERLADRAFT_404760 [Serpula lacrymans var. lacrymans S7.9]